MFIIYNVMLLHVISVRSVNDSAYHNTLYTYTRRLGICTLNFIINALQTHVCCPVLSVNFNESLYTDYVRVEIVFSYRYF
jgi:hypothetical protein